MKPVMRGFRFAIVVCAVAGGVIAAVAWGLIKV